MGRHTWGVGDPLNDTINDALCPFCSRRLENSLRTTEMLHTRLSLTGLTLLSVAMKMTNQKLQLVEMMERQITHDLLAHKEKRAELTHL